MNRSKELDVLSRALSVIVESEGADEHAELITEMRELLGEKELIDRDSPEELIEDDELVDLVAEELAKLGYPTAYGNNTGGNVFCVLVPTVSPKGEWCFGMADTHWGGGWTEEDGGYYSSTEIQTEVFSDEQDAKVIAVALAKGLRTLGDVLLTNRAVDEGKM